MSGAGSRSVVRRTSTWGSAVGAVLLALAGACPHKPEPPPSLPPVEPPEPEPVDEELPPPESEPPPPEPGSCADGGRLWDGKPDDCTYEHGGCCYDAPAQACAAAGCAEGQCVVLESHPAQIRCAE